MIAGLVRVAAVVPPLTLADVDRNSENIGALWRQCESEHVAVCVFPELTLCGYSCGDLFYQEKLLDRCWHGLLELAKTHAHLATVAIIGMPLLWNSRLWNVAAVVQGGKIHGFVPKTFLPNTREYYEKRWFTSGRQLPAAAVVEPEYHDPIPFGTDLLFALRTGELFGIELCEDLWNVIPPSSYQAIAGSLITFNPSASNELVAKADYRRALVTQQSARCLGAYVYSSAGVGESTTDVVYGGHAMVAENGVMLAENERFARGATVLVGDIDTQRLLAARVSESSLGDHSVPNVRKVVLGSVPTPTNLRRSVNPHPFVPHDPLRRAERCREILTIQASGLARRVAHTRTKRLVVGISGGLDSTLALLVMQRACSLLGKPSHDILALTMPGYGTTDRTYQQACRLCHLLGVELREIDIVPACEQHFRDIGHDPTCHDVTYENVQARERTQLLMDIANKESGIVIGTGDLSEIALGWSTYNGDHMSMYAVNCGVPKTLIRYLIGWVADELGGEIAAVLQQIIDTPITPELLPRGTNGEIQQKTEEVIGPYELHDFFLYHTVKYGASPEKVRLLAARAFEGRYTEAEIERWHQLFLRRFFTQQFKRSCIPDGPKVGTIALSPRGDWRMPSDASVALWLE
ncbi:NAD(+) synthase [Chrysiogenes arsenatis]|uniref:NAD(+) synthase n=1 Tax=Chrysiogenes arsenatis TaxID=309797 RepID=UPI000421BA9F|nr:NAD(+) synthase [Chrysiogenes arsenatis]